ncbi:hypothetical protein L596_029336 [Steinernema carpocapsae]|uniref:Uncharacterized protein n=1 Tax=Steinernema carpocapsae TaxID=34508 RepID=A0A4U5LUC0_STECR|nr:hypothetical protein L596_029336 [Steinernema carpocapsae]
MLRRTAICRTGGLSSQRRRNKRLKKTLFKDQNCNSTCELIGLNVLYRIAPFKKLNLVVYHPAAVQSLVPLTSRMDRFFALGSKSEPN